ncbi:MAG: hypothetical protein WKF75_13345 [Singulisphaera sp.]
MPGEFVIGGGEGVRGLFARIVDQRERTFSWRFIRPAPAGEWVDLPGGGEFNAFEANGQSPPEMPWVVEMFPRSIMGEFMFAS